MIGQDHIRRISQVLTGGTVVAVNDVDATRAAQIAASLPGTAVHTSAAGLINDENAVASGTSTGPGAWDGLAAAAVTDAGLRALRTGQRTPVTLPQRPDFYAKAQP